jgi:DNA polymerase III epsilon subunit-like protein
MVNRKKLTVAIIDTETTMRNNHSHLIFDFAFVIGNVYDEYCEVLEKNYLITDTLSQPENFIFSYQDDETGQRIPYGLDGRYKPALERWAKGERYNVATWEYAYKQFWDYCSRMGVDVITAYNLNFDLKAMSKTQSQYTDKQLRLPNGIDKVCLMDICQTFVMNRDFKLWFDTLDESLKTQFTTDKGNLSYSAECMYRYLFDDYHYTEQHTALRDCRMEWKLIRHAFRKWEKDINKHFINNIRGVSWRNANKVFTKKEKLEMRNKKRRTPRQAIQTELAL